MNNRIPADQAVTLTHDVAQALAKALGPHWSYNAHLNGDGERGTYAIVECGDMSIGVHTNAYEGKTYIVGRWEAKDALGRKIDARYNQPTVRVGMSCTRTADAIVKDALRRFVPTYEAAFPQYRETVDNHRAYLAHTTSAAQTLAASGEFYIKPQRERSWGSRDVSPDGERVQARTDGISNVRVYDHLVSMELRGLTPEQAIAVARIVGKV